MNIVRKHLLLELKEKRLSLVKRVGEPIAFESTSHKSEDWILHQIASLELLTAKSEIRKLKDTNHKIVKEFNNLKKRYRKVVRAYIID